MTTEGWLLIILVILAFVLSVHIQLDRSPVLHSSTSNTVAAPAHATQSKP